MSDNPEADALTQTIIQIIKEKKPQDVNQLTILVQEQLQVTEKQILDNTLKLQNQEIIKLEKPLIPASINVASYLKTIPDPLVLGDNSYSNTDFSGRFLSSRKPLPIEIR